MSPEPQRLRLFVAIAVPDVVKAALGDVQRELRDVLPSSSTSWTAPEALHLTLRFLGAIEDMRVPALERALAACVVGFGGIELVCERIGCFPDPRFPRVVWAGVHDAHARLARLHDLVDRTVSSIAEKPAETPFVGHVTIARPRHVRRTDALRLSRFVDATIRRRFGTWRCDELELIRSDPSATGSRYSTLVRVAL